MKKMILILAALVIAAVGVLAYLQFASADYFAKKSLERIYGASVQDYDSITKALKENKEPADLCTAITAIYGDIFTERGCETALSNRIFMSPAKLANDTGGRITVSSVSIRQNPAEKTFNTFQVNARTATGSESTFSGTLVVAKENGKWKIDSIAPAK